MAKYGLLNASNVVIDVIVADTKEIAEEATGGICVELPETNAGIDDTWDGTNFISPPRSESEIEG